MRETEEARQTYSHYLTFTYLLERDIPEVSPLLFAVQTQNLFSAKN